MLTGRSAPPSSRGAPVPAASPRPSSTSSPTTPRPTGSPSTPASTSARCASSTWRRSRRSSRDAGAWSVMAAYNSVNGYSMTESPMLRAILHEEWGFDGVTDDGLVRRRAPPSRPRRAGSTWSCRVRPARGARPWSTPCATAGSTRPTSTTRCSACCALAARVGALADGRATRCRSRRGPTSERRRRLRARRGGRLRAGAQRAGRRCPVCPRPARAPRRRDRPERRRGPLPRRRQRPRSSRRDGLAAGRPAAPRSARTSR